MVSKISPLRIGLVYLSMACNPPKLSTYSVGVHHPPIRGPCLVVTITFDVAAILLRQKLYGRGVNKQQNTPLKLPFVPILVVENGPTSKGHESFGGKTFESCMIMGEEVL